MNQRIISVLILAIAVVGLIVAGNITDKTVYGDNTTASTGGRGDYVEIMNQTNQYPAHQSYTKVNFFVTNQNTGGISIWPEITNTAIRVTQDGLYQIGFSGTMVPGAGALTTFAYKVYINGVATNSLHAGSEFFGNGVSGTWSKPMWVTSNSYVQIWMYKDAAAGTYLGGGAASQEGTFSMQRIR